MSILASKGMSVPTFQPASGKGDGQGNGSGGMFFGQGQQESPYDFDFFNDHYDHDDEPESMPYNVLLTGPAPQAMKLWKTALAVAMYQKLLHQKELEASTA